MAISCAGEAVYGRKFCRGFARSSINLFTSKSESTDRINVLIYSGMRYS